MVNAHEMMQVIQLQISNRYLLFQIRYNFWPKHRPMSICNIFGCFIWFMMWHWRFTLQHLQQLTDTLSLCFNQISMYNKPLQTLKSPRIISFQRKKHRPSYHIFCAWILRGPCNGLFRLHKRQYSINNQQRPHQQT